MKAIVYTSNTGYTEKYAQLLAEETGLPVYSLEKARHELAQGTEIIYLGWLMAGQVMGLKKALKMFKVRAVCQVGMGPASRAASAALKAKLDVPDVEAFTLQGGFDIKKLHGPYKWIMLLKCRQIKKMLEEKESLNEAQQMTYDMATKGASNVKEENLQGIIEWYNQNK